MFEIYSKYGRLLATVGTLAEARKNLRRWEQAAYVVEGRQVVLKKRDLESK